MCASPTHAPIHHTDASLCTLVYARKKRDQSRFQKCSGKAFYFSVSAHNPVPDLKKEDLMKRLKKYFVFVAIFSVMVAIVPALQAEDAIEKININTASAEELVALKYVGEKLAQRIIQFRQENGNFKTLEDLAHVPGVGQKILKANENSIKVE